MSQSTILMHHTVQDASASTASVDKMAMDMQKSMQEQNNQWTRQNDLFTWQTQVQVLQQLAMQPGLEPGEARDLRQRVIALLSTPPVAQPLNDVTEHTGSNRASDSHQAAQQDQEQASIDIE